MSQWLVLLRMERRSALGWILGVTAYVTLMGLLFVAMGGADGLQGLSESYPQEILDALGIEDFSSAPGFLAAEFTTLATLVFGVYLVMLMSKHLAGAEEGGLLDHLLARPVPRALYYWHLLAMGATVYGAMLAGAIVGAVIGFGATASGDDLLEMTGMIVDLLPFGLVFIGIGGLLGSAFHRRGRANGIGAGLVALFFAMDLAGRLVDGMSWLQYVSPTGLLGRSDLGSGDPDPIYWLVSLALAAATSAGGWLIFRRKQIYA